MAASVLFFAFMGLSYAYRRPWVLFPAALVYVFFTVLTTYLIWFPLSPAAAAGIVLVTLAVPILGLLVFLLDYLVAIFCLEMRYLVVLWWLAAPLAVVINTFGLLALALMRAR